MQKIWAPVAKVGLAICFIGVVVTTIVSATMLVVEQINNPVLGVFLVSFAAAFIGFCIVLGSDDFV